MEAPKPCNLAVNRVIQDKIPHNLSSLSNVNVDQRWSVDGRRSDCLIR